MTVFSCAWFILTCNYFRGLAVGIYTTNSPEACHFVAENCEANVIIVENKNQLQKILKVSKLVWIFWCSVKSKFIYFVVVILSHWVVMGTLVTVVCKLHLVLLHALPGGLLVCWGGTYIAMLAPARPPTMVGFQMKTVTHFRWSHNLDDDIRLLFGPVPSS